MKNLLVSISAVILCIGNLNCQTSFRKILDSSEIMYKNLVYVDNIGNYYQRHLISGVAPYDMYFTKVELKDSSNVFSIEGYTILVGTKDTVGMPGIQIFLGITNGDKINQIRVLGESNNMDIKPEHKDGYFSFKTKIFKEDNLFFCSYDGGGLRQFHIGKLINTFQNR